jgi:hypothetical protein
MSEKCDVDTSMIFPRNGEEIRLNIAYNDVCNLIEDLTLQFVELLESPCTSQEVHAHLMKIQNAMGGYVQPENVWNNVYWAVRRHRKGCPPPSIRGGKCGHVFNHVVHKSNAKWVRVYLKEMRDSYRGQIS